MKTILIVTLVTALIVVSGFMSYTMLYNESLEFKQDLDKLNIYINNEDWDNALELYKDISSEWTKTNRIWSMLIDHYEIDHINLDMAELNSFINSKEKHDSMSKVSTLKILFAHIPDKETLTLKNIL